MPLASPSGQLGLNTYGCSDNDRSKECFGHEAGHPNATMRSRIAWQEAFMKSSATYDSHPIGHVRTLIVGTFGHGIFGRINISFQQCTFGREIVPELR